MKNKSKIQIHIDDQLLENLEAKYNKLSIQELGEAAFRHLFNSLPLEDQLQAANPYTIEDNDIVDILARVSIVSNSEVYVEHLGVDYGFNSIAKAIDFSKLISEAF